MRDSTATVSRPLAFPSSLQLESSTKCPPPPELESPLHQKAFKSKYALLLPSQTASARTFSSPSTNQRFKYLYLSIQRHLPIHQIRSLLRRLHINSSHVLDIHYPDHHLVALLIHNDCEAEVRSQLENFEIPLRDDYDPQDPNSLRSLLL
ncbi:hypothetical protein G6F57_007042 [Rhizopus arrhizus]|uniref:Uncharacterized protein n=1 Tax=Rhizopus oryzae TaxID=64495 RepID=A0A9P7BRL5_RHIOR|nr:hypothetical protein G6F23_003007 [Rhizopus arrhizus]KAG1419874.1 hypothetical protein G6F58_004410 [Rhizopus delemar]KAG0948336.1 hypothetical protein G6F30_002790 [Rhizopus arrhizus]KAG0979859.1 hypothetical protein G6F29_008260 [Rhizopus arrhizus]KAG0992319.1 hypothetical protein G6F28_007753 [Rhizopus arrhizus]